MIKSDFIKHINKNYIYISLIIMLSLLYYRIYFFNTVPFTEGWGIYYSELVKAGKIPYKDFYYYLPPLNIVLDYFLWNNSDGMLILYRFYRLLERLILIIITYLILNSLYKSKDTFVSCVFGSILGTACVYDLMGDYNQTALLINIIICYISISYIENNHKMQLVFLGLALSVLFLLKQSDAVAVGLVFFVSLSAYSFVINDPDYWKKMILVLISFCIPLVLFFGILEYYGILKMFCEQVYMSGADSKGGIAFILLNPLLYWLKRLDIHVIVLGSVLLFKAVYVREKYGSIKEIKLILLYLTLLLLCYIGYIYKQELIHILILLKNSKKIILSTVVIAIILHKTLFEKQFFKQNITSSITVLGIILMTALIKINPYNFINNFYKINIFRMINDFNIFLTIISIVCGIYSLIKIYQNNESRIYYGKILVLMATVLSCSYAAQMASGNTPSSSKVLFINIPIMIGFIFNHRIVTDKIKVFIISILTIFSLSAASQKYVNSYSWWGWNEDLYSQKTYHIENKFLYGFTTSLENKMMYENILKLIKDNTEESSVIWSFPHIRIFNLMTNHIGESGFVPILFYDVCGYDYAIKEKELLNQNNPDIIIWCDLPNCIEVHEKVFLNGKELGQRRIVEWFNSISKKKYTKIGEYKNLQIFKKNNNT